MVQPQEYEREEEPGGVAICVILTLASMLPISCFLVQASRRHVVPITA